MLGCNRIAISYGNSVRSVHCLEESNLSSTTGVERSLLVVLVIILHDLSDGGNARLLFRFSDVWVGRCRLRIFVDLVCGLDLDVFLLDHVGVEHCWGGKEAIGLDEESVCIGSFVDSDVVLYVS